MKIPGSISRRIYQFLKILSYTKNVKELPATIKWLLAAQSAFFLLSSGVFFCLEIALLMLATVFWLREQRRTKADKALDYFAPASFACISAALLGLIHLSQSDSGTGHLFWTTWTLLAGYGWLMIICPVFGPGFLGLEE